MREIRVSLGGTEITLKADFAASHRIATEVGDPLTIAREANLEAFYLAHKLPYEPKWKFTLENTVQILLIGSGMEREKLQELVFTHGLLKAKQVASDYLMEIIGPQPEVKLEGDNEEEPGK